jgi:tyrosyl-tRNA synthetase
MRQLLTLEQIEANASSVRRQFSRFLDFDDGRALLLNNADWLLELRYIPFLRDVGRHFSVNQLLQHETYRQRLAGDGLNFIELNYALAQAYDFLHLHREFSCSLQIGGSDQWFNILAGVELIRRSEGAEAYALVTPLISTSSGAKMGKTEAGAVWLDPARTSPYDFYQFWRNTEDPDVERFLKLFTFLPLDAIHELTTADGAEINRAKELLAFEVTRLVHGEAAAEQAQAAARAAFGGAGAGLESLPTTDVPLGALQRGLSIVDALVLTGQATSKTVAKSLVQGGGVYVNGERVASAARDLLPGDLVDERIVIRRGKTVRAIAVGISES